MKQIVTILTFLSVFTALSANAQNKVVVVPMGASPSQADKALYGGGQVTSGGNIDSHFGNTFTVSRTGTGTYSVLLPGYRPGCGNDPWWPLIIVTGYNGQASWGGSNADCGSGDTTNTIYIRNSSGVLTDSYFHFMVINTIGGAPSAAGSLSPTAAAKNSYEYCEIDGKTGVEICR